MWIFLFQALLIFVPVQGEYDSNCLTTFSKKEANSFLCSYRRHTPTECCQKVPECDEMNRNINCKTEEYRSYIESTLKFPCKDNTTVKVTRWCPGKYTYICTDICDALDEKRCLNGGTCISNGSTYDCLCPKGFTGKICQINTKNLTKADVIFVLDSSASMTKKQFHTQLQFVANFSTKVSIGPDDVRMSVITFSSSACVELSFNESKDNTSVIDALMNIAYKPGATRTDRALEKVKEVLSSTRKVDKYVHVITDGMSSNKRKTKAAAKALKDSVDRLTVTAIGIGNQVLHQELNDIASDPSNVYSVNNFDSLNTILKSLTELVCDDNKERTRSFKSDVAIFLDSSNSLERKQYDDSKNAIIYVITKLDVNVTRVSVTTFSNEINTIFEMGEPFYNTSLIKDIGLLDQSTNHYQISTEDIYGHARRQIFNSTVTRQDARKFLLMFTTGYHFVKDSDALEREKSLLRADGVNIIAVGSGDDVNLDSLYRLVTDTFNVLIINDILPITSLDALQSSFG